MSGWKWNKKKQQAALLLAQGYTTIDTANQVGATDRTLYRWKADIEFSQEIDRLSLMIGIASRAERLRIAQRVARELVGSEGIPKTEKDLLDWLKYAQSETDGIKLDLTTLIDDAALVAGGRPTRATGPTPKG